MTDPSGRASQGDNVSERALLDTLLVPCLRRLWRAQAQGDAADEAYWQGRYHGIKHAAKTLLGRERAIHLGGLAEASAREKS